MRLTSRHLFSASALALTVALTGILPQVASAATITYGDFGPVPPGVSFLDVAESSATNPVPLYGPPTAFTTGLDFTPTNFVETTSSGGADLTDGQLNFTLMSNLPIEDISLFELGDYTLSGTGSAITQAQAGAVMFAAVTEINGVAVAPINLVPVLGSVSFDLFNNAGNTQPWSLGLNLDVANQVAGATKIDVVLNNTLVAVSESSSVAFIGKRDFRIQVEAVPEPATLGLAVLVSLTFGVTYLRRRMTST